MTFGSLFAGIGGMDLGLERAGMQCRWQVEIDPFCRKVLAKHWPEVPKYGDIRELDGSELERVDCIAGGFPCQDISYAGSGRGLSGERSGLWFEFARIIRAMEPRYVLVENVAAIFSRGLDAVLGTLADSGYDAEWSCVSACSMGAPHMRRRVFIVAHSNRFDGWPRLWDSAIREQQRAVQGINGVTSTRISWAARLEDPSELYRGADGVPFGLERNRPVGNSVAPDVAEWIGRRILESVA